ncbi:MAG: hypothetical protein R3F33_17745 [Planctomycetota bacterium]
MLLSAFLTLAPVAPPAPVAQDVLSIYLNRTEALLKHPKDRGLVRVLDLLNARLLELPSEIREMREVPPQLIPAAVDMLNSAKTIRLLDARETSPMIPLSGHVSLMPKNAEQAAQWMGMVEGLMRQAGAPLGAKDASGMVPIEGGPMPVVFGVDGGSLVLHAGSPASTMLDLSDVGLPAGIQPDFGMRMDLGTMLDMFLPFLSMQEPEAGDVILDIASATGLDSFSVHVAAGSTDTAGYSVARMPGFGQAMRSRGVLPVEGLTSADLALIPADANMASMMAVDMKGLFSMVLGIAEPYLAQEGFDRPLERIEEMVGVHIERDLLDHLGTYLGSYTSDTTGGGGMMSMVMFIEAKDPAKLEEGLERISNLVNNALAAEAKGYVQMRSIDRAGMRCHTLTFPGLPIPAEPTLVVGKNNLFIALTPQAAVAGAAREGASGNGLLGNSEFMADFDGNFSGLYGVSFYEADFGLREGYGLTSLLCSGLSNGVRSRLDVTRDAGLVMPTFHELAQGVRATVGVTRINEGGDIVCTTKGDPSVLVNLTRGIGIMASNPATWLQFMPLIMGQMAPRMMYAQEW